MLERGHGIDKRPLLVLDVGDEVVLVPRASVDSEDTVLHAKQPEVDGPGTVRPTDRWSAGR